MTEKVFNILGAAVLVGGMLYSMFVSDSPRTGVTICAILFGIVFLYEKYLVVEHKDDGDKEDRP